MPFPNDQPPGNLPMIRTGGCMVLTLVLFTACLLPFFLVDFANSALKNLHLPPAAAFMVIVGTLLGSAINLPIARFPIDHEVPGPIFEPFSGWNVLPQMQRLRTQMVVAVNVGGCVIPILLATWLCGFIVQGGSAAILVTLVGMTVNAGVCYVIARPVPHLGIALPFFVPAMCALSITWFGGAFLAGYSPNPQQALQEYALLRAPIAFVSGISGPLIGADLLHWKDFGKLGVGTVSIGGAGTWDGIVLSGLIAAFFA